MGAQDRFDKGAVVGLLVLTAMMIVSACSHNSGVPDGIPKNSPTDEPIPERPAEPHTIMSARAIAGLDRDFDAVYELASHDPSGATVRVMRTGRNMRIDVDWNGAQSRLLLGCEGGPPVR